MPKGRVIRPADGAYLRLSRKMMPHRLMLYKPFSGLMQGWEVKLPVALLSGLLLDAIRYLLGVYSQLLVADPALIVASITLLAFDSVTGVWASLMRGEKLSSRKLRDFVGKVVMYAAFVFVGIITSNAFADTIFSSVTSALDDAALLYVCITEGWSCIENAAGSKENAKKLIATIKSMLGGHGVGTGVLDAVEGGKYDESSSDVTSA